MIDSNELGGFVLLIHPIDIDVGIAAMCAGAYQMHLGGALGRYPGIHAADGQDWT